MGRWILFVANTACIISSYSLFLLMLMGVGAVIMRAAGYPVSGAVNLGVYLLLAVVYFSIPYVQMREEHLSITFLVDRFPFPLQRVGRAVMLSLASLATLLCTWASWEYSVKSLQLLERMDGEPYYPLYPSKLAVSVGLSALSATLLCLLFDRNWGKRVLTRKSSQRDN
ncbi:MAG: TRAP transporter small permease subunit [Candidatus Methanomethyliaceae archaeon]